MNMQKSTGSYLTVIGGALVLVGLILFFAKAGFPPSFTTTYKYTAHGVEETTTPGTAVIVGSVALLALGAVFAKAGSVVKSRD